MEPHLFYNLGRERESEVFYVDRADYEAWWERRSDDGGGLGRVRVGMGRE